MHNDGSTEEEDFMFRYERLLPILLALALGAAALPARAQDWPARPIRLVVAFAPGGVHDTVARVIAPRLTELLGQAIVIDNRPGAGGNIAADLVAKAAPDGYTFLVASEAIATNEFLYRSLSYDPKKDLAPVTKLADYPMVFVAHPGLPANTLAEFVRLARDESSRINFGSAGLGTSGHLAGELFKSIAGVRMEHVPYKGGAPAMADLVAGRIQVMIISVSLSAPQLRPGRIKAFAVAGRQRAAQMPEVPTTAESGYPDFEALLFSSLFAPSQTPAAIVARMSSEVGQAMRQPEVAARLRELGAVPAPGTPEEFRKTLEAIGVRWGKLIRDNNIRVN